LLVNACIRTEIQRLKEIKKKSLFVGEEDVVEFHMRIAFADIWIYTKENMITADLSLKEKNLKP